MAFMLTRTFFDSLSTRLLVLTVGFVLISEAIILVPSIARSYQVILQQKIDAAYLVASFIQKDNKSARLRNPAFLENLQAYRVALRSPWTETIVENPDYTFLKPDYTVDLNRMGLASLAKAAMQTLQRTDFPILQITGSPSRDIASKIEIILDEATVRQALAEFTSRNIQLSVSVAIITATLVFAVLQFYMVAPLQRLSSAMTSFRLDPENPANAARATKRRDEIGTAQNEFAHMQNGLRLALRQKARLAALGTAVAKINHDLRNILSTAQLMSDRMAASTDPNVQKLAPRLLNAIDRANALCAQTLDYVREGAHRLERKEFLLSDLVEEAGQNLRNIKPDLALDLQLPEAMQVNADREELYRVLTNLLRNAIEAGANHIAITAEKTADYTIIRIADDGPGLKPTARERLFQPFAGSARKGGTGLGLAIARDLMRAHGGDLTLAETGPSGTVFALELPDKDQESLA